MRKYLSISTVIFGLLALILLTDLNFGGVLGFGIAAIVMMPVIQDFLARKTGREKMPFLARGVFAFVGLIVGFLFMMASEVTRPTENTVITEQPTQRLAENTESKSEPAKASPTPKATPVPNPIQTPKPTPKPEKILDAITLFATKPSKLNEILGKPSSVSSFKQNEYGCEQGCENRTYTHAGLAYELIVSKKENRVNSAVIEPANSKTASMEVASKILAGATRSNDTNYVENYTAPGIDSITVMKNGNGFESIFLRIEY